jgi:hypothetical protein
MTTTDSDRNFPALAGNDIAQGIADSFDRWLVHHDVSAPESIEYAVKTSFDRWLEEHTDDLVAAIATQVAEQLSPP